MKRIEDAIQIAIVDWIKKTYPVLRVHATLNENSYTKTAMGSDIGIPDILIFHRRDRILHMLFLELKTTKGKLQPSQIEWAECYEQTLASKNTRYAVAKGFEAAKNVIADWMK